MSAWGGETSIHPSAVSLWKKSNNKLVQESHEEMRK